MTLNFLTWLGGSMPYIDITPDADTLAMLDEPAACDKHRALVGAAADDAAIEQAQARIVAKGGSVTVAQHVKRLKERQP